MSYPRLEDVECGFCHKLAVVFYVHGYRCREHSWQEMPSMADPVITVYYGTDGEFMIHHKLKKGVWNAVHSERQTQEV